MFKFLKKNNINQEVDVIDKNISTAEIIEEIHNEFNTAGDKLLTEAKNILANLSLSNEEKSKRLHSLGFISTPHVKEMKEVEKIKEQQEKNAKIVMEMQQRFPNHKFISGEMVEKICKKYGLVLGGVSQYKGFVPDKNIQEIEKFFETYPDLKETYYQNRYSSHFSNDVSVISKSDFLHRKEDNLRLWKDYSFHKNNTPLNICAPLKDMEATGYKLEGHKLMRELPDPVVLLSIEYIDPSRFKPKNEGYLILSAWGDESSDALIINEKMN